MNGAFRQHELSSSRFTARLRSDLRGSLHKRHGADVDEGTDENFGEGPRDYRRQEGGHGRHRHRQGDVSVGDEGHQIRGGAPCGGVRRNQMINQTDGGQEVAKRSSMHSGSSSLEMQWVPLPTWAAADQGHSSSQSWRQVEKPPRDVA